MSEYSYQDPPPRHRHRTREREPEYVSETTYIERGGRGAPVRDLVYRPAREDSIEDIPRNFPPPGAEYRQTKYRETYEPRRGHRDYDDDYDDRRSSRPSRDYDYYSDDYERRPKPQRRKSVVDNLKEIGEAAGLGGVIGAVTGRRSRSRSRPRKDRHDRGYDSEYDDRHYRDDRRSRRYSSSERSRSRGPKGGKNAKWEQAAKAAIVAGAVEAFRSRKEPGPWTGAKGQRIATAALGAAGIDSLVTSEKHPDEHSKRHVAESALGGLVASRLANGSRSQSRGPRDGSRSPSPGGRSRSRSIFGRSRSRGRSASRGRDGGGGSTIKDVAGAGAVLAAGKALYDRVRSKSRSRRDRSRSVSSEDSYVPSRSRRNRDYSDHGRSMDGYSEAPRANPDRRVATTAAAGGAGAGALTSSRGKYDSSDSESTTDMEQKRKKLRAAAPYPPTAYADANPYGAVPPPPIGAPPAARY